jgi:hypothetical protein
MGGRGLDSYGSGQGKVAGCFESGHIKYEKFLN